MIFKGGLLCVANLDWFCISNRW